MADTPDVVTLSNDRLTRLLSIVEKVEERNEGLIKWKEEVDSFRETFDAVKERLQVLEDKGKNPGREMPWEDTDSRRDAARRWIVACYRDTFMPGYTRDSGDIQLGGTDAAGGYLVPDLVAPEIIRIVENVGVARRLARVMPMGSDTVRLTSRDTSSSKGVKVLWEGEGATITEDKEEFTAVNLVAKRLAGLTEISDELEQDAAVMFADYLLEVFAEAIAKEEDTQLLNSTTPFTGVLDNSSVTATVTGSSAFAGLTYDDFVDAQYGIDASLVTNGVWVVHPKLVKHARKIKDDNGNPIWGPMATNQPATILGDPYFTTTAMPSSDGTDAKSFIYGDFRHAVIGTRTPFAIAFSAPGGAGFTSMSRYVRVSERIAVAIPTPAAFTYLKNAAS